MTIYQGSRFERSEVVTLKSSRGWRPSVVRDVPSPPTSYIQVVVKEFETIEQLAARMLGDPEQWWRIADANPDVLYPDNLPPGFVIKVPYVDRLR